MVYTYQTKTYTGIVVSENKLTQTQLKKLLRKFNSQELKVETKKSLTYKFNICQMHQPNLPLTKVWAYDYDIGGHRHLLINVIYNYI